MVHSFPAVAPTEQNFPPVKSLRAPLLLFALPAILLAAFPAWTEALIYHRINLAHGELWRLWTAHWVHFSPSHLAWNLLVLLAVGTCLEQLHPGLLLRHTLLAAPLISLALWFGEPAMQTYAGLSGLATATTVLLAVQLLRTRTDPLLGSVLLVLIIAKLAHDLLSPTSLFTTFDSSTIRPSVLAHLTGATLGLAHSLRLQPAPKAPAPCQLTPDFPSSH